MIITNGETYYIEYIYSIDRSTDFSIHTSVLNTPTYKDPK